MTHGGLHETSALNYALLLSRVENILLVVQAGPISSPELGALESGYPLYLLQRALVIFGSPPSDRGTFFSVPLEGGACYVFRADR